MMIARCVTAQVRSGHRLPGDALMSAVHALHGHALEIIGAGYLVFALVFARARDSEACNVFGVKSSCSAMRARSSTEEAFILRMIWPRWAFTVTSLTPMSPAICLLSRPFNTSAITSR